MSEQQQAQSKLKKGVIRLDFEDTRSLYRLSQTARRIWQIRRLRTHRMAEPA